MPRVRRHNYGFPLPTGEAPSAGDASDLLDEIERDRRGARELDLEAAAKLQTLRREAMRQGGLSARDAAEAAYRGIATLRDEMIGRTSSPRMQAMFDDVLGRREEIVRLELNEHVRRATEAAEIDQAERLRDLASLDAVEATTPFAFHTNLRTMLDAIDAHGRLAGLDSAEVAAVKARAHSAVHRDRLDRMIDDRDTVRALAWHKANRDALSGTDAAHVEARLQESVDRAAPTPEATPETASNLAESGMPSPAPTPEADTNALDESITSNELSELAQTATDSGRPVDAADYSDDRDMIAIGSGDGDIARDYAARIDAKDPRAPGWLEDHLTRFPADRVRNNFVRTENLDALRKIRSAVAEFVERDPALVRSREFLPLLDAALMELENVPELIVEGRPPSAEQPRPIQGDNRRIDLHLPAQGTGYTIYGRRSGQYATERTTVTIEEIGRAWSRLDRRPISIGNISNRGGGPMAEHSSHRNGTDIDIRPFRTDGRNAPVTYGHPAYDQAATLSLLREIHRLVPGARILFNDPVAIREGLSRPYRGHDNHMHVRLPR